MPDEHNDMLIVVVVHAAILGNENVKSKTAEKAFNELFHVSTGFNQQIQLLEPSNKYSLAKGPPASLLGRLS